MATSGEHDRATVEAAQRGALWAQDELVATYLPLVYNIVGRALRGHADVDDVVQDTMLRALHHLGSLHDAGSFRPWLVAITMNQIRNYRRKQQVAPLSSDLRDADDMAAPGADFVDLTILRLGLEGQRREVAEATRWLDDNDRELLSLWWLEAAGELERSEVAAALEMSARHTAVRVQRMRAQLETARLVVRALSATPRCAGLDQMMGSWDGVPSALWRKRISRHVRDCTLCSGYEAGLVPAEGLLVALGLVPVAGALAGLGTLAALGTAGAPDDTADVSTVGHTTPEDHLGMGDYAGTVGHVGAPGTADHDTATLGTTSGDPLPGRRTRRVQSRIRKRRRAEVAAAVALLIAVGTIATLLTLPWGGDGSTVWSTADSPTATPTEPATSPPPTASSSTSPTASKSTSPSPRPTRTKATPPKPKPTPPKPKPTTPKPTPPAAPASTPEGKVLALVNAERAKAGCDPVKHDDRLARAAQLHSEDMSANDYFDHTSLDGSSFGDRAKAQGHSSPGAENIAQGQNSPESVMDTWMNSEGHRNNILNCSLTTLGVGLVEDDWTWTQVFGF